MANFRQISYATMLYETLRHYFTINTDQQVSILYKFLAAILAPLQQPFNDYDAFRVREAIIANCKWQIGQLTNVLNYLFDTTLKRIFITQSVITIIADPEFAYPAVLFDSLFTVPGGGDTAVVGEREFFDKVSISTVTINVPTGVDLSAITAVIEQIRIQGIPYQIVFF